MNWKEFEKLKDKYKNEAEEKSLNLVKKAFKKLFDDHPEIKTVQWYQYIPSYNDGDPCEFTTGEFLYSTTEYETPDDCPNRIEYEKDDDDKVVVGGAYDFGHKTGPYSNSTSVVDFEDQIDDEELLRPAFGLNVMVTFTRNWHSVEGYYE